MNGSGAQTAALGAGLLYLAALTWAMSNLSFDIWGALLLIPVYGVLGVLLVNRMFRGALAPVATALSWGLALKLGGACARYWVGFEAYDGGIDAGRYHEFARAEAGEIWSGGRPVLDAIPTGTGTAFVDEFTALVYTLSGGSKLGGFITFSFLAYIGVVFFVKAAAIAIPNVAVRKYAWLCALAPSLVYWPSSIGKEAIVLFGLGTGTYGVALLLAQHRAFAAVLLISIGLGFTALIRPHMSGIWLASLLPALVLSVVLGRTATPDRATARRSSRPVMLLILGAAGTGFAIIASITVRFLQPKNEEDGSSSITEILEETARRTSQAGSNFAPPSISSPLNWPFAVARTLTRPLPIEAAGLAQLISAAEMVMFFLLIVASWKRVRRIPRFVVTCPYVLFALTVVFLSGLAFTSLANLGVLTRQRSLVIPFMLLLLCMPRDADKRPTELDDEHAKHADRVATHTRSLPTRATEPGSAASDLDNLWAEDIR